LPARRCGSLSEVQKCKALTDAELPSLTQASAQLAVLNLTDCQLLRRPVIESERLRTLHLYNCLQLLGVTVRCPNLELLNLTYCLNLVQLSLSCEQLRTLLCAGCKQLCDESVLAAATSSAYLRSFDLKGCSQLAAETLTEVERLVSPAPSAGPSSEPNKG